MTSWIVVGVVIVGPLALIGAVVVGLLIWDWQGRAGVVPPVDGPTLIGPGDPLYGSPHQGDASATGNGQWR